MVMGSNGRKNPSHSATSMKPFKGVSVRVTTQAKKIANTLVIMTRTKAK